MGPLKNAIALLSAATGSVWRLWPKTLLSIEVAARYQGHQCDESSVCSGADMAALDSAQATTNRYLAFPTAGEWVFDEQLAASMSGDGGGVVNFTTLNAAWRLLETDHLICRHALRGVGVGSRHFAYAVRLPAQATAPLSGGRRTRRSSASYDEAPIAVWPPQPTPTFAQFASKTPAVAAKRSIESNSSSATGEVDCDDGDGDCGGDCDSDEERAAKAPRLLANYAPSRTDAAVDAAGAAVTADLAAVYIGGLGSAAAQHESALAAERRSQASVDTAIGRSFLNTRRTHFEICLEQNITRRQIGPKPARVRARRPR
jgi:hypothetical protein